MCVNILKMHMMFCTVLLLNGKLLDHITEYDVTLSVFCYLMCLYSIFWVIIEIDLKELGNI